ncbi:hypothetical protein [Rhodococcus spongiicola]|uniref:Uncharacterized protein n=1 Tax=Rhodococcus spongiicola TaxID=2487352 RepID=A0A3S3AF07_9NOCA|nr:hypothetical protein [Rhodococcus spongiicola]RVW06573.1 hypothetical protein EF834_03995 [Rhodococcus spongiicola]
MGFIQKALVVVAVTLGLVAGGSGIAQANTASVEPSIQAVSAMTSTETIVDTVADGVRASLGMVVGSVMLPFVLPLVWGICAVTDDYDEWDMMGFFSSCTMFGSS